MSDENRLAEAVTELTRIKDVHVVSAKNWFERHASRPRILFRTSGLLVIIFSVSIPLLGVLGGVWTDLVLPVLALAIAGLTGLNSFFQWQASWQGYIQAQLSLEHIISLWELKIAEAKYHPDLHEGLKIAIQATDELLENARRITSAETGAYFEKAKLPEVASQT